MSAVFPTSLISFTTKEDKIDIVYADHVNKLQDEVVAVETELGLNVAGSLTNLVDRLALLQDTDGSFAKGSALPTNPIDGQGFYKSDENVLYIYNGASWDAQGQSLSNCVFSASLFGLTAGTSYAGIISATSYLPTYVQNATKTKYWWAAGQSLSVQEVLLFKYQKLSGQTTISCYGLMWIGSAGQSCTAHFDIGGQTATAVTTATFPTWASGDVDVSGLDVGTYYDINIKLQTSDTNSYASLGSVIGIAS